MYIYFCNYDAVAVVSVDYVFHADDDVTCTVPPAIWTLVREKSCLWFHCDMCLLPSGLVLNRPSSLEKH